MRRAAGCKACGGSGYRGRVALVEVLPVDDRLAKLIGNGALPPELATAARPFGMRSLWECGLDRVWQGITSLDEVIRVLGDHAHEDHSPDTIPAPAAHPASAPASSHVLIADDDRQMRRLIRMVLERDGYRITEAADGLDALEAIEQHQFDLVLLDLDMPRLDGMGVMEKLRARVLTASVPVIVLTARGGESETEALDLGALDFLSKPVQPGSLLARARAVLRRTRPA